MSKSLPRRSLPAELAKTQISLRMAEDALARTEDFLSKVRLSLEREERKFIATFEKAAVGMAHVDLQGQWLEVNQSLCDIVGYHRDELLQISFQDITYPGDFQEDLDLVDRLVRGEIAEYQLEKRYVQRDGQLIWVNLSATLVRDRLQRPLYFVAVIENIHTRKLAEQALDASQRRLTFATESMHLGLFDFYGIRDTRNYWSYWVRRHFGIRDESPLNYQRLIRAIHPEDRPRLRKLIASSMAAPNTPFHAEYRTISTDPFSTRWIETSGQSVLDTDTDTIRLAGTTLDITSKKLAALESRTNASRIRTAFDNIPDILVIYDRNLVIRYVNPAVETTSGMPPSAFIGRREDEIFPAALIAPWQHALLAAFEQGARQQVDVDLSLIPGVRHLSITFVPLRDPQGFVHEVMGIVHDDTERKLAENDAVQAALHDPLTGLPNRVLLFDYSSHVFDAKRRHSRQGAVLFINLDRFKLVNDLHGHQIGDDLLQFVADRLKSEARKSDQVFRLSGDEFLVLMSEIADSDEAAYLAERITQAMAAPFAVSGIELQISASTGIALYPRNGDDVLTLLNAADQAMHQAKEAGKNHWQFFSSDVSDRLHEQLRIQHQLRTALKKTEFELRYQPIVQMLSGELVSFEALLRWPAGGVNPEKFIVAAESVGQIIPLGDWVIEQVCLTQRLWQEEGLPTIPVAINVSAIQLRQKNFLKKLHDTLRKYRLEPGTIQIELTESTVLADVDHAIRLLTSLRDAGVKISLDDFGTGFSSLSYLSRLPLDKIKIDKSFVQHVMDDTPSRAVTEAIITLGQRLNLEIVAEGIENDLMLRTMRGLGCHQGQGFFIGRPVPPHKIASRVA